jgi:DUF971 family protein
MPAPKRILVAETRDTLSLEYDQQQFNLSAEYLRVFSPSAEVRGHGQGQQVLQFGKKNVKIESLVRSGNYAIQLVFSDGHDSGIYSWDYLFDLATNLTQNWSEYLDQLHRASKSREPETQVVKLL